MWYQSVNNTQKTLVWEIANIIEMYTGHTFHNAHGYMSVITECKNKFPIIHISRDALKLKTLADSIHIYSACLDVTKDYGKWQELSKLLPEK